MSFFEKLTSAIIRNQSLLIVGLDPNPEMMPRNSNYRANLDNLIADLRDWLQFIIAETSDLVCAYKPTLGFYEVLGNEGWQLLSEVLAAIPEDIPIILDAKYGDINTSSALAHSIFTEWNVDAVTLNPYAGQDQIGRAHV